MYELQNINQDIIKKFYDAIKHSQEKDNWHSIILVSVKNTLHDLLPQALQAVINEYAQVLIQPILDLKNTKITIRNFHNENESFEVYNRTYKELIEECENSEETIDKDNLVLIDYIYELLEYDKIIIVDDEKSLYSFKYLSTLYKQYLEAYNKLESNKRANKSEKAINTSSNTATGYQNKVKFINEYLEPSINHPNIDSSKEELQIRFIQEYDKYHHIMARSIYSMSRMKDKQEDLITNALSSLVPFIDSDGEITKNDLYVSWYASIFLLYKSSKMPVKNKLELARLSSYVVFPNLNKNNIKTKNEALIEYPVSRSSVLKPVREKSFFNGLRLYDFSDGRFKITKTKDEIEDTEKYLKVITKHLNRLS